MRATESVWNTEPDDDRDVVAKWTTVSGDLQIRVRQRRSGLPGVWTLQCDQLRITEQALSNCHDELTAKTAAVSFLELFIRTRLRQVEEIRDRAFAEMTAPAVRPTRHTAKR